MDIISKDTNENHKLDTFKLDTNGFIGKFFIQAFTQEIWYSEIWKNTHILFPSVCKCTYKKTD